MKSKKATAAMVICLLLAAALWLTGCSRNAASIGIIGGADGPTAIFVTSNTNGMTKWILLGIAAAAVLAVMAFRRNKKK